MKGPLESLSKALIEQGFFHQKVHNYIQSTQSDLTSVQIEMAMQKNLYSWTGNQLCVHNASCWRSSHSLHDISILRMQLRNIGLCDTSADSI